MTIMVTGATGLLGNNVVRTLLAQGRDVRVLCRPTASPRSLEGLAVEQFTGDVTNQEAVRRAVEGATGVIHCAGFVQIGWGNADIHDAINVGGATHVGRACRDASVPLIHVSTVNALGLGDKDRPADEESARSGITPCPYVLSKRAADETILMLADEGLRATIVYPGFLLGPWDWKPSSGKMLLEVARRWTPLAPVGGFSVCDVRHVAQAVITALDQRMGNDTPASPGGSEQPPEAGDAERFPSAPRHYILAGENLTYLAAWQLFAKVSGGHGPIFWSGPLMRIVAGRFGDWWGKCTGNEPEVNSAAVQMSGLPHYFSSDRAVRELGYDPGSAEGAARAAWEWFQEYGYTK